MLANILQGSHRAFCDQIEEGAGAQPLGDGQRLRISSQLQQQLEILLVQRAHTSKERLAELLLAYSSPNRFNDLDRSFVVRECVVCLTRFTCHSPQPPPSKPLDGSSAQIR